MRNFDREPLRPLDCTFTNSQTQRFHGMDLSLVLPAVHWRTVPEGEGTLRNKMGWSCEGKIFEGNQQKSLIHTCYTELFKQKKYLCKGMCLREGFLLSLFKLKTITSHLSTPPQLFIQHHVGKGYKRKRESSSSQDPTLYRQCMLEQCFDL